MREARLRSVLLIKAIEETEGTQFLIPDAERTAASRQAQRNAGSTADLDELRGHSALPARVQRMLAERADILLAPVLARHPFVKTVLNLAAGPSWVGWIIVALSVVGGGALSALDGPRRIDILSLPLIALIAWNLIAYAVIIIGWLRFSSRKQTRPGLLRSFAIERILANLRRFVDRSEQFNAPLAHALNRFIREWSDAAKSLLLARASRLFHLCAAATGLGLIAGLYLRGVTLDYTAGWESTFIEAPTVHALLLILYGPASAVTGIALPDASYLQAIRWQNGVGGERAAYWIHLLTASIALFIILPRLALALLNTVSVWRRSIRAPLPPSLAEYVRKTFGTQSALGRTAVVVIPYAYEPSQASLSELHSRLTSALGQNGSIDVRPPVRYGDEETVLRDLTRERAIDVVILLLNLAATPEEENHGTVLAALRQRGISTRPPGRLLVMVDEYPYALRMTSSGGPTERMGERRRVWQAFVEKYGSKFYLVNLAASTVDSSDATQASEVERLRSALLQSGAV